MNKGFTLIELLIVIAIIGILSTSTVFNLSIAKDKAELIKAYSFEQSIASRLTLGLNKSSLFDEAPYQSDGIWYAVNSTGIGNPFRLFNVTYINNLNQCLSGGCYDVTAGRLIMNTSAIGFGEPDNTLDDMFAGGGAISIWFKPTAEINNDVVLVEKGDEWGFTDGFWIMIDNQKRINFIIGRVGTNVKYTTPTVVKNDKWQYLGIVFDSNDIATINPLIVINGTQQELTITGDPAGTGYVPSSSNMNIGASDQLGFDFEGLIDRVILYGNAY